MIDGGNNQDDLQNKDESEADSPVPPAKKKRAVLKPRQFNELDR